MQEIQITENEADQRLDRFIRKYLADAPLGLIYKYLRKKMIKVNGKKAKHNYRLQIDDIVQFDQRIDLQGLTETVEEIPDFPQEFQIVYEDENILVVGKPAGLLVHADRGGKQNTLNAQVLSYLYQKGAFDPQTEVTFTPAPSNRLDRNTSGLVLFAKNYPSQQALNQMIKEQMIDKYYLALVRGKLKDSGEIKGYLYKDPATNQVQISETYQPKSQLIHTRYRPKEIINNLTLVEVELLTGRTHQIRAHMAFIGHPIIGDPKYGDFKLNDTYRNLLNLNRQFLHANRLVFSNTLPPLDYLINREFTLSVPKDLKLDNFTSCENY